jgi:hypothetical protein
MKLRTENDKAEYKRQTGLGEVLQHSDIEVWIHALISKGRSAKLFINLKAFLPTNALFIKT